MFDDVRRAWAVWMLCAQSFSSKMNGPWGYDKSQNTTSKKISSKRDTFRKYLSDRLKLVQLECADAIYIIESRDSKDAFFYCDPPYVGTHMAHYKGYTERDYERLLDTLTRIEGKFLLSSYPSSLLTKYTVRYGWCSTKKEMYVTVNMKGGNPRKKVEVLTSNYSLPTFTSK